MAEWLTHVLLAYALFTLLGWHIDWLDEKWVAVGMVGSLLPDLSRLGLVIPAELVHYLVGTEFSWGGIHTLGSVVLMAAIGALLFRTSQQQRRAFALLFGGAIAHMVVDLPQRYADGNMLLNAYSSPIPTGHPPTPGWYVSPDLWTLGAGVLVALAVFVLDYRRSQA